MTMDARRWGGVFTYSLGKHFKISRGKRKREREERCVCLYMTERSEGGGNEEGMRYGLAVFHVRAKDAGL